jgi:hypothetical protein|tara:strand:+ start:998 stop:1171 length:174 start_codon:yes stop_codon:yes gene_type:complete
MGKEMGCCGTEGGFAATAILIGVAYALQHKGVIFSNVVLWPWVLIAIGVVTLLHKKK